ncbi:MAG: DinB family protein [Planctomycetota bacterium]|jgi:uncharacterized damage-inducible protein DinB
MFTSIEQFETHWTDEAGKTLRIFESLTDESLGQEVAGEHRTIARIASHITTSMPEMLQRMGIKLPLDVDAPVPVTAAAAYQQYATTSNDLLAAIQADWTDETLSQVDDMYGMQWKRGFSLYVLLIHQTHHRGQMTVLMRQAGLKVPGIYGPAREEWEEYGMQIPEV